MLALCDNFASDILDRTKIPLIFISF